MTNSKRHVIFQFSLREIQRRKAYEEALNDKRVQAVENIISLAITRLIDMFKPAVHAFFMPALVAMATSAPATEASETARALGASALEEAQGASEGAPRARLGEERATKEAVRAGA